MPTSLAPWVFILSLMSLGCSDHQKPLLFQGVREEDPKSLSKTEFSRELVRRPGPSKSLVLSINQETGVERELLSQQEFKPGTSSLPPEVLRLEGERAAQKLFPELELRSTEFRQTRLFSYVSFQQYHLDRLVVGAELTLRLDAQGDWVSARSSLISFKALPSSLPTKTVDLVSALPESDKILNTQSVWYPRRESVGLKVYAAEQVQVFSTDFQSPYLVWVNTENSEVIGVHHPEYSIDGESTTRIVGSIPANSPESELIEVELPKVLATSSKGNLSANGDGEINLLGLVNEQVRITLENEIVTVVNNGGRSNEMLLSVSDPIPEVLNFDNYSLPEERNIYYWVTKAHRYFKDQLGFDEMRQQIIAMARDSLDYDNAYFNPLFSSMGAPTLGFGMGKNFLKNTGLSRDVIIHEFTHAVTFQIYGMKATYEFSAMNEGFSDYYAATITNDPRIGEDTLRIGKPFIRTLDNTLSFDHDFNGRSFHADSQLFSGALWEIRRALGAEKADRMIHEARLSKAATIAEFYGELLRIDDAMDENRDNSWRTKSPNFDVIRKAFLKKGLHSRTQFIEKGPENLTRPWGARSNAWVPDDEFPNINL